MKFLIKALSYQDGFLIELYDGTTNERLVKGKTKDRKNDSFKDRTFLTLIIKILSIATIVLLIKTSKMDGVSTALWAFLAVISFDSLLSLILEITLLKKQWQWHGLEHQLAYLYTTGEKRTRKNLDIAPRANRLCGSKIVLFPLYIFIPIFIIYVIQFFVDVFFMPYMILIFFFFIFIAKKSIETNFQHKIFLDVSIWLQRRFTTRKPEDWQIKQTLELAKELDAKLTELGYSI